MAHRDLASRLHVPNALKADKPNPREWPEGEVLTCVSNVCSRGNCRRDVLPQSLAGCDPMYGPAVRCKRFSSIRQMRSCINVSGL
jgi:hypothetical protein